MTSGVHVLEDGSTNILSEHLFDLLLDIEAFSVGYTVGCLCTGAASLVFMPWVTVDVQLMTF